MKRGSRNYHWQQRAKKREINRRLVSLGIVLALAVGLIIFSYIRDQQQMGDDTQSANANASQAISRPAIPQRVAYDNKLAQKTIEDLRDYGSWLRENKAKGYIGEMGWPAGSGIDKWNAIADQWFTEVASYDIWVTAWAAGSWWGNYSLTIYGSTDAKNGLNAVGPQAKIFEKYLDNESDRRGINLAGMEFGSNKLSSASPGKVGTDYFYEPASSYKYLSSRGVRTVRLPFRWERVQPVLNQPLNSTEVKAIQAALDDANDHGIKVVLDLHNYGEYISANGRLKLGEDKLPPSTLADVWHRLSDKFGKHPALLGYGIMNEPKDLPTGNYKTEAKHWEAITQNTVTALRKAGDKNTIFVSGYDWSSLARWRKNHPTGWINDPANNFRYEAHHYWDGDGTGFYAKSFADELQGL